MFQGRTVVIATMHGKERVIAPLMENVLDVHCTVCKGLNTDDFGTFTREVPRLGNQLEAARSKALKALEITGETLAIASEGSFGPHPWIPFIPGNIEFVMLIDQINQLEITGKAVSSETNYSAIEVGSIEEALKFAERVGFPEHGLVVCYRVKNREKIRKCIFTQENLITTLEWALSSSDTGGVYLETDMRAHFNPTRMKVIQKATEALIGNLQSHCPGCQTPGYAIQGTVPGLPCEWCGWPTQKIKGYLYRCVKCGFEEMKICEDAVKADPGDCLMCNP